jgi:asparagine synthase (glutamine-hydrolysing)
MCGILGCIGKYYEDMVEPFIKDMHHRGPDDRGSFIDFDNRISLGQTRLSIIDTSPLGHQPMQDSSGRFHIVFNGEIYNYKELKNTLQNKGYKFKSNSDTETLLYCYIEWGVNCVQHLRGMFAFAIYDKGISYGPSPVNSDNKIPDLPYIFMARDRIGIKPLLYFLDNESLIFASELKPFLNFAHIPKKINYKALENIIRFGSVTQPNTIINNISHLMPGHYMIVDKNLNKKIYKYYDLSENTLLDVKNNISNSEIYKLVKDSLVDATKYHMVADVDIGAFLSGGIDSAAVVSLMSQLSSKPIKTFTIGFEAQNEVNDELAYARETAQFLGTDHNDIIVTNNTVSSLFDSFIDAIDQPSIDGINTFLVSHFTSKHVKVALSGLGGDETFIGYSYYKDLLKSRNKNNYDNLATIINRIRPNKFTNYSNFINKSIEETIICNREIVSDLSSLPLLNLNSNLVLDNINKSKSPLQRITLFELKNYLSNTLLRDTDAVSMAFSLEVRPILLDHQLIETVLSLPDNIKINNNQLKHVLIESIKPMIPKNCWTRKKAGFEMPFLKWMNSILYDKLVYQLNSKNAKLFFSNIHHKKIINDIENKKFKREHWLYLVLFSWLEKHKIDF